jgi:hypothetical protein
LHIRQEAQKMARETALNRAAVNVTSSLSLKVYEIGHLLQLTPPVKLLLPQASPLF